MDSSVQPNLPGTGAVAETRAIAPLNDGNEVGSVTREMVSAYKEYVRFYRERMGKTPEEAMVAAAEPADDQYRDVILANPPDQISWLAINALAERDPALAQLTWERIKQEARDELASGHRAARPLEGYSHSPWERAQFLVVRESLAAEWQPRNGIERMLVDSVAQAFTGYEYWLKLLMSVTTSEGNEKDFRYERDGKWYPTRLSTSETLEQAAQMVERFHRMLIRVQRALRDQRRYGLNVGSVGQLNIGMVQQNVVSDGERGRDGSPVIEGVTGKSAS